jgi:tripartite-type tricarboxylate transporter receptor subunit TctC
MLNYSSGGNGTNFHMAVELLKNMTGANIMHVPYRGGGLALAAVVSGEAKTTITSLATAVPLMSAGRVRALAITSVKRSPAVPDIPTVHEAGVPQYEFSSWVGLLAPGGTPKNLVQLLNRYTVRAARDPALAERFANDGLEIIASTPEAFRAQIKIDLPRWAKVIRESGIRPD